MNKKEILLICLICLCLIGSISAVASADVNLDSTDDKILSTSDSDVVGTSNDLSSYSLPDNNQILRGENDDAGSFSDLQTKIDSATGSTITLDKNYTYNKTSDISLGGTGVLVNGVLTIEGQAGKNITIDGLGMAKIFTLNGDITLRNINFIGGSSFDDSSIHSTGKLTVENCNFTDCFGSMGGAIHALGGLDVSDSNFKGNDAMNDGGSIYIADSALTSIISDCTFEGDSALKGSGGSISSATSLLTLRNLDITDCYAGNDGGAIMLSGHNTTLDNVNITKSQARNHGGAIYFRHNHKLLSNLRFEENSATYGGAIYCYPECEGIDDGGLENVTFIANSATQSGGAMHVSGDNGRMKNCTFKDNRATYSGAAMFINSTGWRVNGSTFNDSVVAMGYGGAIYVINGDNITIDYCNFTGNSAWHGGAISCYNNTDNAIINNSRFISNSAIAGEGGAIYLNSYNATVETSCFENNKAESTSGLGGAIAIANSNDNVTNCTFIRNSAHVNGGAIIVMSTATASANNTIRDSIFEYNDAGRNGGAISLSTNCPNGTIINSTFRHNSAYGSAGALGVQSDYAYVYNSTFEFNEAEGGLDEYPGDGGAIAFTGNHNYAYNTTFTNNTAKRHGGAAYVKSTSTTNNNDTTFELCKFINNTAKKNGGAIDWSAGSIYGHVFNSTFTNNSAYRSGGAIYWSGTNGEILYSNFTNNQAKGIETDGNGGGDGGAILWVGSHGQVDHCNFTDNFAKYRGGSVFLKGESDTVHCNDTNFTWCRFINNTAGLNGGAIDWQAGANNGRLVHSIFINNTAWRSAGAVYWYGTNGTIDDCNFTNNTAVGNITKDDRAYLGNVYSTDGGNGGAVVWTGSLGTNSRVNFINNTAKALGGAMFLEQNDNVTISYANFTNNYAGINGGALDWYKGAANGRVEHATFINNTAERSGGAIYWYGHNGTLYNVTFKNNRALGNAHYINPFGENTTGGDGGAIFWTGYDGNVTISKFINNTAAKRGGAVFLQGASDYYCNNTRFKTALFENNTAGTNGGAIDWFKGATHGVIDNATFNNNIANRSGGAVYWNGAYGDILNSNFTNNTAKGMTYAINAYGENTTGGSGGAIIWSGSHGEVINCRFTDNNASRHGGAVYMQGTSEENCTNTTFDLCYFEGNNATINGGALDWHEGAHNGLINNSNFTNNRARANGGAVYWEGHNGNILNSNFTYNYALGIVSDDHGNQGDGGSIIWAGLNGNVDNCWFKFNNATARGGAVYLHSCAHGNNNTTFMNSHFINNTAGTNGGAIDWHAGAEHGLVNNSEFINNTAGVNGGAIYWNGYEGDIIDSNFTYNFAYQNGGAVYWEGHVGIINGSRFEYNNVSGYLNSSATVNYHNPDTGIDEVHYDIIGGDGGAIIWKGSDATIENSTFYKNYAPYRGGAIFFTGMENENCTNVTIIAGNFTLNHAGLNGGALDWSKGADNATILDSYFINNTADRSAGAIYVSGNDLDLENTVFEYNRVTGNVKYDNRTDVSNYTSIGGNGGAICWMGSYGDVVNVTFLNNTATQRGGAIQFERNVNGTVKDSRFINNSAGTEGGAIDFFNGAENGKIINSNFTNNTAVENGGAIFWQGHHGTINGSRFENNKVIGLGDGIRLSSTTNPNTKKVEKRYNITGGDGGAIKWTGSHGIIENTTFYGNNATYNGGAIYLIGNSTENCTNITFINCNFTGNLAKLNGGAVFWATGASNATVSGSYFVNNTADRSAGAIYISGNYLDIKDSQFKYNKALETQTYDNRTGSSYFSSLGGNAGAICWMGSYGTVDNGTFINNTAAERGGAIQFERNKNGTVKNSYFENNSAYDDGGAIDWYKGAENGQLINSTFLTNYINGPNGRGSGVYIEGYNATIKDSRFERHNSNADGGVIYIEGDEATVDNSTFENIRSNKRGGAIFVAGDNTTISKSNFTDVHADKEGGAVYVDGTNTTITDSKFNKTYSLTNGGAIYVTGTNTTISGSNFTDSDAKTSGGAIYVAGKNTNITLSYFESCQANGTAGTNGGGAIYVKNAENTNILNSTFKDGSATQKAGAIYVDGSKTTIDYSNFTSNNAKDAGAIYVSGDQTNITNSNFISNYVGKTSSNKGTAGALYVSGSKTNITNCTFDKNEAWTAGALYVDGSNTAIEYSNFTTNRAYADTTEKTGGSGGAAYILGEDSSLKYCNFDQNHANGNGGAVVWKGGYEGSEFIGCNFTKNYIDGTSGNKMGGAVYFTSGGNVPASIKDCRFEENHGPRHGGAIDWYGASDGSIENCTFIKNYCGGGDGGALYIGDTSSDSDNLTIIGCTFFGNYAYKDTGSGGAISNQMRLVTIKDCNFTNNYARYGGAVIMKDGVGYSSQILNCTFENCYTTFAKIDNKNINSDYKNHGGGALFLRDYNITVANSTFINCSAMSGGAIRTTADAEMKWPVNSDKRYKLGQDYVIDNCTFINCSAAKGGAVYIDGQNNIIANSTFTNNSATYKADDGKTYKGDGGAVYWTQFSDTNGGLNGKIYNSTFVNNTATGSTTAHGGAVYWEASNGHVYNSTFNNNSAINGGAVYWNIRESTNRGNNGTVNNCTFENNRATNGGGAVNFDINDAKLYDSNFTNNSAKNGGSVYFNGGFTDRDLNNCTFVNGSSDEYGGDIYVVGNSIKITNFTSYNATSNEGGSIALMDANNVKLTNITVDSANATANGGAIFVNSASDNNEFTNVSVFNSQAINGGAIYIVGTYNTFDGVILINNSATDGGSIYVASDGLNTKVINVYADNSTASENGGAIYWAAKNGNMTFVTIKNSKANKGGAIYWTGEDGTLDNANFTNNHAVEGGALYWNDASSKFTNTEFYENTATYGGAVYWNANGGSIENATMIYNRAVNGSAIYIAGNIENIINTTLLDNQAHSYEIYNPTTTIIERTGKTITVFTLFRGGDNLLNAIYNSAQTIALTNVTYWGYNGKRNTNENGTVAHPIVLADNQLPYIEDGIFQTNLEVYQVVAVYAFDGDNALQMNVTGRTDYRGAISFDYTDDIFDSTYLNIKVFHPEDNYYTYIAFANATKLPTVIVEADDIYFHETEYLNITVRPDNITETDMVTPGNVTVYLHGKVYNESYLFVNVTLIPDGTYGRVTIPISGLHVDTYDVYVNYSGNKKFIPEYNSTVFSVLKINSTINLTVSNYYYGDTEKVIIRTTKDASNNVSVILNGQQYWIEVDDTGYAELDIPLLNAGNYTVEAFYPDARDCYESANSTAFEVYKVNSTINITGIYDDNFNTVRLHIDVGPADTYGNVVVTFDGKDYELSLTNSTADLTIMHVPRGEYVVNATYGGDMNHWGSNNTTTISATKFITPIIIDVTNITYGENETIIITVPANATGNLTITFNGKTFNKTIENGIVILENLTLAAGDYPVYVSYAGDDNYAPSTNQTIFNVAKAIPVMDPVVENITYGGIEHIVDHINQTGNVSIIIRDIITGKIITQNLTINITNKRNVTWNVTGLPRGNYIAEFIFSGNQNYTDCAMNRTFVVDYATPLIIVEVDNIYVGQNATVNVTVFPQGNVTGIVTIYVDGIDMGNFTLDGNSFTQLFDVSGLLNGTHDAVAVYHGDANYTHRDNSTTFEVYKHDVLFNLTTAPSITVFDDGIIHVNLPANATGIVYIKVNDTPYYLNLSAGRDLNIGKLKNGTYTVQANYSGDYYWNSAVNTTSFIVSKVPSSINVTVDNVTYGDKVVINITTSEGICGNVTVDVNGTNYTAYVSGGHGLLVLDNVKVGEYPVNVTFDGCAKYLPNYNTTSFKVSKINATTEMVVIDQGNGTVVVILPGNATGYVNITIGNDTFNATVVNGTAVVTLENATPGLNNITVVYSGDGNYTNITANSTVIIPKLETPISVDVHNIYVGDVEIITVHLPVNATGTVTIEINGQTYTNSTIVNGDATFRVSNLAYGNKTVAVTYSGNANYTGNFTTENFTVNKRNSHVNLTVTATTVDQDIVINVTIPSNATGIVVVKVDNQNYTVNTTNGNGSLVLKGLANGAHAVNVTYLGDNQYFPSGNSTPFALVKVASTVSVSVDNITYGDKAIIKITVPQDATGNVTTVIVNGQTYYVPVSNGTGLLVLEGLDVDTYTVKVTYNGDGKYLQSAENETSFTVSKINATADIKVIDQGNGTVVVILPANATGYVNITIGNDTFNATVINGTAVVTLENATPGLNNITVFYSGDGNYTNITVNSTVIIPKLEAPVSVDVHNIYVGDVEIITVHLPVNATGTVTIEINGQTYTNSTMVNGNATFTVPNLAYGNKTVAVTYSGDANYTGNFTTANFTVNKRNSQVNLTVTASVVGIDTVINVTIPANATGYVLVNVANQNFTINTTNGNGSLVIKCLANGNYAVNVTYLGDEQYFGNTNSTDFTILRTQPTFSVNGTNITYGAKELIKFESVENITAPVTVEINGTNYTSFIIEGKGNITVDNLAAGKYNVTIYFAGNYKYLNAKANNTFTVAKATTPIYVIPQNITFGEKETLTIYVNATGYVAIHLYNATTNRPVASYYDIDIIDYKYVVPGFLDSGDYVVVVDYEGNANYTESSARANFTVYKKDPTISIQVQNITYGDVEHIIVHVDAEGSVTIKVNGTERTIDLKKDASAVIILRLVHSDIIPYDGQAHEYIYNLDVGEYPVEVTFNGNRNFNVATANALFFVNKDNTTVSVDVADIRVDGKEIINVTINNTNATGSVVINVDGVNHTVPLTNGAANLTLDKLANGTHSVVVIYRGDNNFRGNWTSATFNVTKIQPDIEIHVNNTYVGQTEIITVDIPKNATGFVVIDVDGTKYHVDIIKGQQNVTIEIDNLENKTYQVSAEYSGDGFYYVANDNAEFNVSKVPSSINATVSHEGIVAEGNDVNITVHVPTDATGKVNITLWNGLQNVTYTIYVNDGVGSLHLETPEVGIYNVTVKYLGDHKYLESENKTEFDVYITGKALIVETKPVTVAQNETIDVWVSGNHTGDSVLIIVYDSERNIIAEQNATFNEYFNSQMNMTLANLTLDKLPAGEYSIEAIYLEVNGTKKVEHVGNGTFEVSKLPSTISIKEIRNITVGENVTIELEFEPSEATGNISVFVNGVEHVLNTTTLTLTIENLPAEEYFVHAVYFGDHNYDMSNASAEFKVSKIIPTIKVNATNITVGEKVLIEVSAPDDLDEPVLIDVGGVGYYVNMTNGKAQLYVPNLASGDYNVTAKYLGDDKYTPGNNTTGFKVSKVASSVNVTVENITVGNKAIINLETPKDLCGNVTVSVDGDNYTVFVSGGVGTLVVPDLDVGPHTVNVTFDGCKKYEPSDNSTKFSVNKIESDIKVIDYGNGTVVVVVGGNATGNVTIKVGDEIFNATVVNGTAVVNVDNITPGTHSVEVIYSGDDTFTDSTVKANITAPKYDTPIDVVISEVKVGENATVTVTVPENATGNVTVTIDGQAYTGEVKDGVATVIAENLTAGSKSIIVEYLGDDNYKFNYTIANFTVESGKVVPDIKVVDQGNGTVVVVVGGNATGNVTIKVGEKIFNATVVNGTAVVNVDNITPGTHSVEVIYSGDDTFTDSTVKANITAPKYDTPIDVVISEVKVGENATVTVTVPENATGNVTVTIDGQAYTGEVKDGVATVIVENLTAGSKSIIVEYLGDDNYKFNYTIANFTVESGKVVPDIKVVDQGNGTVVVVVGGNATGNVTIKVGEKIFNATVVNGTAVVNVDNITPGTHSVEVIYSGDDTFTDSTVKANITAPKYDTPIDVVISEVKAGENATLTIKVPENATGNVTVTIDGQTYAAEVDKGIATIAVENLTVGPKSVIVEYSGDDNYVSNYTISNFTVEKVKVVPDVKVVDLGNGTVVVVVCGNASGNATVKVGENTFNGTVVNGTATIDVGNLTPGINEIEVIYFGDDVRTNKTISANITGPKYDTPINVTIGEVKEGENATVTIKVPENATGNVTITVDGQTYTAEVDKGIATIQVENLTAGPKSVIVEYEGDDNYISNYTISNFTVEKAKVTPEIIVVDQGNGTVVVVVGDNATGNVTVKVGNDTVTAPVVNGTAVITLDNLTPGKNNIEVVYSGDDTHNNATVYSTITGPKYDSPINVTIGEVKEGENAAVTIKVPENATGNVTITVDGQTHTAEVVNGTATIQVENLTAGPKSVIVEYSGDDNYSSNYTIANFTVEKAKVVPDVKVVDLGNGTVVVVVCGNASGNATVKVGENTFNGTVVNGTATIDVGNLTPGINEIEVIYSGDDVRTNKTISANITGPKYDTPINVTIGEVKEGENATVTIKVPENATGNVTITVDGQTYTAEVVNGTATIQVENLTAGPKSVIVEYSGDNNYNSNYTIADFAVEKAKVTPEIIVVDQGNGTVVVVVGDNATGNVTVKVGNDTVTAPVVNGTAVITLDNLTPGKNNIEVIYSGDGTHNNATINSTVTGPKRESQFDITTEVGKVGENTIITVNVPSDAKGNVTIEVDGVKYNAEVENGVAKFEIGNLTEGTKTIAVEYTGDDNYLANHTTTQITISKRNSFVKAEITDINVGEMVNITVHVPDGATGQVLIDIDGVGYYVNVTDGVGTTQIPRMPNGIYVVNLTYIGDDKFLESNNFTQFNVNKLPSYVIPTANNIAVGKNEIIVFEVPTDATGNLTVIIDGKEFVFDLDEILGVPIYVDGKFSVAVSGGKGVLVLSGLLKGKYNVTVTYNGNYKYLKSTNTTTFTVSEKDTDLTVVDCGNGTVKVYVSDNATGNITIKVGNQTYVGEVVDGVAVIDLDNVSAGTHDIEVIYSGDDNHSPKTVESSVSIPKKLTPISVEAHDIYVGETEHIVVTVPEGATGIISIEINAKQYNATIENGKAVFDVEGLAFGNKTVAVTYWGDGNYVENFTTGQFEVKKLPSNASAFSKDIKVGKDETIKVTVPSDATGIITVTVNGVDYSGEIVNGKVNINVPNLPAGKYSALVTYSGDDKYLPCNTTTEFEVYKTSTPISASGDYIVVGEDGKVVINLPSDATGTVTITVDGKKYASKVVDGKAMFKVPGLAKGVHVVYVYYSGDDKYDANETVTKIVVDGDDPVPHRNGSSIYEGKAGIDLSNYPTGNPIFVLLLIVLTIGTTQIRRFRK